MKKRTKLGDNGIWESSRMMLFEHRDALIDRRNPSAGERVEPGEERRERYDGILAEALRGRHPIRLDYWRGSRRASVTGYVTRVDAAGRRIHVRTADGAPEVRIPVDRVIRIEEAPETTVENRTFFHTDHTKSHARMSGGFYNEM